MGLGVGIHCEACRAQLYYDTDCEEIIKHVDHEEGRVVVKNHPVLCHECRTRYKAVADLIGGQDVSDG